VIEANRRNLFQPFSAPAAIAQERLSGSEEIAVIPAGLSRLSLCTLFAAAVLSFGSPSIGRAQNADVKAAVDANHAAIQSRNISDIAAVWSHEANVTLVNPYDTTVAVGWDAVKGRWEKVFDIVSGLEIAQTDGPHITTMGNIAWSADTVHVVEHFKSKDTKDVHFLETDVFLKQDGHWLIASHTAKPM
jgi:ketosteroid isomerase-like protein